MDGAELAALIPAYDAAETVAGVVRGVRRRLPHVLVIDDGSADETAELARAAGAEVVRHQANRGKGAAIKTGLAHLAEAGFTHAFTIDADGQHLPSQVPILIEQSAADPRAIVVGVRRIPPGSEVAGIKRFGNHFANWWVSLAAGSDLPDTQSGFRIYPIQAVRGLEIRSERYDFESEVLIRAMRCSLPLRHVEVDVHYPPPEERRSHYDPWVDTCRIIFAVVPYLVGWRR